MTNTHTIDNYPGILGKTGTEIAIAFFEHAQKFGAEYVPGEVIDIKNIDDKIKTITLKDGQEYNTKTIIVATGMQARKIDVPGYNEYFGKGVSTCVVCDGAFYRNEDIALIGGGNSATEESLFISNIARKVYIVNKFPSFRAEAITLKKLKEKKNIIPIHNADLISINGNKEDVTSITIKDVNTKKEEEIKVSGVFNYTGFIPFSNFFNISKKNLDSNNFIKVDSTTMETAHPGIFAIGDVISRNIRQVSTAVSDGTIAALKSKDYIDNL